MDWTELLRATNFSCKVRAELFRLTLDSKLSELGLLEGSTRQRRPH